MTVFQEGLTRLAMAIGYTVIVCWVGAIIYSSGYAICLRVKVFFERRRNDERNRYLQN